VGYQRPMLTQPLVAEPLAAEARRKRMADAVSSVRAEAVTLHG
jgi:hypothetical protein